METNLVEHRGVTAVFDQHLDSLEVGVVGCTVEGGPAGLGGGVATQIHVIIIILNKHKTES